MDKVTCKELAVWSKLCMVPPLTVSKTFAQEKCIPWQLDSTGKVLNAEQYKPQVTSTVAVFEKTYFWKLYKFFIRLKTEYH